MKLHLLVLYLLISALQAKAVQVPWATIEAANGYWATAFGYQATAPKQRPIKQLVSVAEPASDASLQLINAALQHHISALPGNDLYQFADSLKYVLIYLSGGAPKQADAFDRAGWWALSYPVAVRYGLVINANIDERFDFEKSTRVAMLYSRDLQRQFRSTKSTWLLAFTEDAIALARPNAHQRADSLLMILHAVKKITAASEASEAERYAVRLFYGNMSEYRAYETMLVDVVVERTGIPEHVFRVFNPELKGAQIPAKRRIRMTNLAIASLKKAEEDILLLSTTRIQDDARAIAAARTKVMQPTTGSASTTAVVTSTIKKTHRVKSGESLGILSDRFNVSIRDLKKWNNLRSDVIYAGQKLIIYATERQPVTITTSVAEPIEQGAEVTQMEFKEGEFITYKVKSGDTLYSIARRFPGVSADNIMAWNGVGANIKAGQRLKIMKSEISDYAPSRYPDVQ